MPPIASCEEKSLCLSSHKGEDRMAKRQVMFTFPQELIREPIIYSLGQQFKIVTNIRQADVTENRGWVMLELEGEDGDIEQGIAWVTSKGVRVDPVAGDVVEG
jgi:ABC-type methionine transport system ATPase subunit